MNQLITYLSIPEEATHTSDAAHRIMKVQCFGPQKEHFSLYHVTEGKNMLRPCLVYEKSAVFKGKVVCGLVLSPIIRHSKRSSDFKLEKDVVPHLSLING
jgi:hypothetical protein